MKVYILGIFLVSIFIYSLVTTAATFKLGTKYQVCFTPEQNCTARIVNLINHAKCNIYVQGYSFTSNPIARALVQAKDRGIEVLIILDKSQFTGNYYSSAFYFLKHGIPVWDDNALNIAHNKVIIVDKSVVETGSFNYTISAQRYNAENVLIIHSKALAKDYLANWYRREKAATRVREGVKG